MFERRLKAFRHYQKRAMPTWGADLSGIDFDEIYYYLRPEGKTEKSWTDVPDYVKRTFDKLGIPEAEQKYLAGVGAQYDSESVYHNIRKDLEAKGVIFMDTDSALKQHEHTVRQYFASANPAQDSSPAAPNPAEGSYAPYVRLR